MFTLQFQIVPAWILLSRAVIRDVYAICYECE